MRNRIRARDITSGKFLDIYQDVALEYILDPQNSEEENLENGGNYNINPVLFNQLFNDEAQLYKHIADIEAELDKQSAVNLFMMIESLDRNEFQQFYKRFYKDLSQKHAQAALELYDLCRNTGKKPVTLLATQLTPVETGKEKERQAEIAKQVQDTSALLLGTTRRHALNLINQNRLVNITYRVTPPGAAEPIQPLVQQIKAELQKQQEIEEDAEYARQLAAEETQQRLAQQSIEDEALARTLQAQFDTDDQLIAEEQQRLAQQAIEEQQSEALVQQLIEEEAQQLIDQVLQVQLEAERIAKQQELASIQLAQQLQNEFDLEAQLIEAQIAEDRRLAEQLAQESKPAAPIAEVKQPAPAAPVAPTTTVVATPKPAAQPLDKEVDETIAKVKTLLDQEAAREAAKEANKKAGKKTDEAADKKANEETDQKVNELREKLNNLFVNLPKQNAPLIGKVQSAQLELAQKYPTNRGESCILSMNDITAADIASGNQVVFPDDGNAFDLAAFVKYHNQRRPGDNCDDATKQKELHEPGKYLINPFTRTPYSEAAVKHLLTAVQKYNHGKPQDQQLQLKNVKGINAGDLSRAEIAENRAAAEQKQAATAVVIDDVTKAFAAEFLGKDIDDLSDNDIADYLEASRAEANRLAYQQQARLSTNPMAFFPPAPGPQPRGVAQQFAQEMELMMQLLTFASPNQLRTMAMTEATVLYFDDFAHLDEDHAQEEDQGFRLSIRVR